jgi:nucleotide-binding universal stress UspA family protein
MFRDILVPLMNVPDSDAAATLEKVAATAARLGGAVSGMGIEVDYAQPIYMYADAVVFMSQAFRDAEEAGHARVEDQLRQLSRHCAVAGVGSDVQIIRAAAGEVPGVLARRARLHDLTMFALGDDDPYACSCVEGIMFGSGRPVMVVPRAAPASALSNVVVAWDFSREAARAFADAMPILRQAANVTVLHVTDDGAPRHASTEALERHLERLDIGARFHQHARGNLAVHESLETYARSNGADLIVMGAYGHSRLQEFVLGGVTREVLKAPFLPVLLSH